MENANEDYFNKESQSFQDTSSAFTDFLRIKLAKNPNVFTDMLAAGATRYLVQVNDPDLAGVLPDPMANIIARPLAYIAPFEDALSKFIQVHHANILIDKVAFSVGFEGAFGANRVSPRDLNATRLGQLVCVEGVATKLGSIRPKLNQSVYSCIATGRQHRFNFHDSASLVGRPTASQFPTKDDAGNPLSAEFGLSTFEDRQALAVQEMPERAPPGDLPCSVDVVLARDLCDKVKPGDRIQIVGVYVPISQQQGQGETSAFFRTLLVATSVQSLTRQAQITAKLSEEDVKKVIAFEQKHGAKTIDILSRSIAPSIYGHHDIKRALLFMLLGGVERNLDNGGHIRGDINVLMCGDPSTAKSQLLRYVLHIAPLALNTTGRGSSGVGLTAAVTTDRETGERRLEAGAMVLADRGVVCIDEFDKMSDLDRVAIHEVMEQQTVTIAKAGLHMTLNARCSVLAAANPVYGRYDSSRPPHFNIGLQDSLLSRFDLLFIVTDDADAAKDRAIALRVLSNHRYRSTQTDDDVAFATQNAMDEERLEGGRKNNDVYVRYDRNLHASIPGLEHSNGVITNLVTTGFVKKYVQYARERCQNTTMDDESLAYVEEKFAQLRDEAKAPGGGLGGGSDRRALPVTARALETLIRLASAHAKARLSLVVTKEDCRHAFALVRGTILAMGGPAEHESSDDDSDYNDDVTSTEDDDDDDDDDESEGNGDNEEEEDDGKSGSQGKRGGQKRPAPKSPARGGKAAPASPGTPSRGRGRPPGSGSANTASPVPRGKRARAADDVDKDMDADDDDEDDEDAKRKTSSARAAASTPLRRGARTAGAASSPATGSGAASATGSARSSQRDPSEKAARVGLFASFMNRAFRTRRTDELHANEVLAAVNSSAGAAVEAFTADEMEEILTLLSEQNKCMYRDNIVTRL